MQEDPDTKVEVLPQLPVEIWKHIFSYLPQPILANVVRVNKIWGAPAQALLDKQKLFWELLKNHVAWKQDLVAAKTLETIASRLHSSIVVYYFRSSATHCGYYVLTLGENVQNQVAIRKRLFTMVSSGYQCYGVDQQQNLVNKPCSPHASLAELISCCIGPNRCGFPLGRLMADGDYDESYSSVLTEHALFEKIPELKIGKVTSFLPVVEVIVAKQHKEILNIYFRKLASNPGIAIIENTQGGFGDYIEHDLDQQIVCALFYRTEVELKGALDKVLSELSQPSVVATVQSEFIDNEHAAPPQHAKNDNRRRKCCVIS